MVSRTLQTHGNNHDPPGTKTSYVGIYRHIDTLE